MKGFTLDPELIKWGLIGLLFLGQFIIKSARKAQKNAAPPPPPQSSPLPSSFNSPQVPSTSSTGRRATKDAPESPWSDLK